MCETFDPVFETDLLLENVVVDNFEVSVRLCVIDANSGGVCVCVRGVLWVVSVQSQAILLNSQLVSQPVDLSQVFSLLPQVALPQR